MTLRIPLAACSALIILAPLASAAADSSASSSASTTSSSAGSAQYSSSSSSVTGIIEIPSSCYKNPEKDKCIPDMLKQQQRVTLDFVNQQARKRQEWVDAHAYMGRTKEYLTLLQEYSNQLHAEAEAFLAEIKEQTKAITEGRKLPRGHQLASSTRSSSSSTSNPAKVDALILAKCAKVTDKVKYRICIRAEANKVNIRINTTKTYNLTK